MALHQALERPARQRSSVGVSKAEASSGQGAYAFGPFVVDPLKRRLWRDGQLVPITSKTFEVLVVLLEQRDHNLSKDELLSRVWPDTAVNENNLARQISSLRRALGQRPDEHDFVVTIPGHGYRFVATVRELPDVPPALRNGLDLDPHPPEPAMDLDEPQIGDGSPDHPIPGVAPEHAGPDAPRSRPWGPWLSIGMIGAAICTLVAVAVDLALRRPGDPKPQPRRTLQRITYEEASLPRDAAWAPDGQWVVYATDRAGNADLWKQRLGRSRPAPPDDVGGQRVAAAMVAGWAIDRLPLGAGWRRLVRHARGRRRRAHDLELRLRAAVVAGWDADSLQAFGGPARSARPCTSSAWMDGRRVRSGPTSSVNSRRCMQPGIRTAGASRSGGPRASGKPGS